MSTTHFVLQKKCGTGKSFVACLWHQYLLQKGYDAAGIDTDPSNHTYAQFKGLPVFELDIMNEDKDIDSQKFDHLVELVCDKEAAEHMIIDSGTSCFVPFISYLEESAIFDLIAQSGHKVFIHVPVMGGPQISPTLESLNQLLESFPTYPFIVWKNPYLGPLTIDGVNFDDFKLIKKASKQIKTLVNIPQKKMATFCKDVNTIQGKNMTFDEAVKSNLPIVTRQRLKFFWDDLCLEMKKVSDITCEPIPPDKQISKHQAPALQVV
jgi:hypothetical protein